MDFYDKTANGNSIEYDGEAEQKGSMKAKAKISCGGIQGPIIVQELITVRKP